MNNIISTANTRRSKELLQRIYYLVPQNEQKEVENVITYDYSSLTSADGATPEASESEGITHHY